MTGSELLSGADLREAAMVYLSRYGATRRMVEETLKRKIQRWCAKMKRLGFEEDEITQHCFSLEPEIEQIISDMIKLGAINDREFVCAQLRHQFVGGNSSAAIKAQCQSKGVSTDDFEAAYEDFFERHELSWDRVERYAALRRLYKKRLGPFSSKKYDLESTEGRKYQQKALGSLARAGFSYSTSQDVLDLSLDEAQDILQSMRSSFW